MSFFFLLSNATDMANLGLVWQTWRCTPCTTGNYLVLCGNLRYRNVSVKSLISNLYFC